MLIVNVELQVAAPVISVLLPELIIIAPAFAPDCNINWYPAWLLRIASPIAADVEKEPEIGGIWRVEID